MIGINRIGDPIAGRPAQPTGRAASGATNLEVIEDPRVFAASNLRSSLNPVSNTYLDESSWRGDGANVISDRLNFGGRRFVEGPAQVQYVQKPVERIVYEDEIAVAPVIAPIIDDSINQNARNILAEAMARVALLIMENNRLKYIENLRTTQLGGVRTVGFQQTTQMPVALPPVPIIRQSNPIITQGPMQQRIVTGQPV